MEERGTLEEEIFQPMKEEFRKSYKASQASNPDKPGKSFIAQRYFE